MIVQDHDAWASAFHPQDPLSPHTTAAMVQAFSDARYSPLTGAPMGAAVVTGDSADMHSHLELRWYIDLMDGVAVDPATAGPEYEGVQAWSDALWAYRPSDPRGGAFGEYGFPRLPTLLADAIAHPVTSPGLPAPWYAVYGNHDTLLLGTFELSPSCTRWRWGRGRRTRSRPRHPASSADTPRAEARSSRRSMRSASRSDAPASAPSPRTLPGASSSNASSWPSTSRRSLRPVPSGTASRSATSTPVRRGGRPISAPACGRSVSTRANAVAGPDGALPDVQFQWLRAELERAQAEQKLVLVLSHHNSLTLENGAQRPGQEQILHHAEEVIDLLVQYPVAIAWLNGHTHLNQILAHRGPSGGGFWEITTASCIDFPQQQQVVEIVDNRDGTLSLFTTVLDHASPAVPGTSGRSGDLASRAREFAANDWAEHPTMRRGSPLDRNTELLLPAPFDLSIVTDAELEAQRMTERARLLAHEGKAQA